MIYNIKGFTKMTGNKNINTEKENLYSKKAKEFHELLTDRVTKTTSIKDKSEVFKCLSALTLSSNRKLGLHLAKEVGLGDESKFYIYNNDDEEDYDLLKYIKVSPTEMGIWQTYLIMTASTVMPVFWHGGYSVRKYIYNISDIYKIDVFNRKDIRGLLDKDFLLPKVEIKISKENKIAQATNSNTTIEADVYCCYWNDWQGLVREHSRITITNNNVENHTVVGNFVIYEYDCGICF